MIKLSFDDKYLNIFGCISSCPILLLTSNLDNSVIWSSLNQSSHIGLALRSMLYANVYVLQCHLSTPISLLHFSFSLFRSVVLSLCSLKYLSSYSLTNNNNVTTTSCAYINFFYLFIDDFYPLLVFSLQGINESKMEPSNSWVESFLLINLLLVTCPKPFNESCGFRLASSPIIVLQRLYFPT